MRMIFDQEAGEGVLLGCHFDAIPRKLLFTLDHVVGYIGSRNPRDDASRTFTTHCWPIKR